MRDVLHCKRRRVRFVFSQMKQITSNLTAEAPCPAFHCLPPARLKQFWQDLAEVPKPGQVTLLLSEARGTWGDLSMPMAAGETVVAQGQRPACISAPARGWETWAAKQAGARLSISDELLE